MKSAKAALDSNLCEASQKRAIMHRSFHFVRFSQRFRTASSTLAAAIRAARVATALRTAILLAAEEPSTWSRAGTTRSRKGAAPSAPRRGPLRATLLISAMASLTLVMVGSDFQPKALRRNRGRKVQRAGDGVWQAACFADLA